jgi:hypothetical protein
MFCSVCVSRPVPTRTNLDVSSGARRVQADVKMKVIPIERCYGEAKIVVRWISAKIDQRHGEVPVGYPMTALAIAHMTIRDCLSL